MTPIERLIAEHHANYMQLFWYAQMAFEKRAKAEIATMVEHANRSLGQLFRQARERLK